jgi:hypothetical protein
LCAGAEQPQDAENDYFCNTCYHERSGLLLAGLKVPEKGNEETTLGGIGPLPRASQRLYKKDKEEYTPLMKEIILANPFSEGMPLNLFLPS